jgi:hypothetical protein
LRGIAKNGKVRYLPNAPTFLPCNTQYKPVRVLNAVVTAAGRPMVRADRPTRILGASAMSRFYLLPPRPELGERFTAFLNLFFPGLDWDSAMRLNLAEVLGQAAGCHEDVVVVYRDDLPIGEPVSRALEDGFGAEPGDEVIVIRQTGRGGDFINRRFRIDGA